MSEFVLVLNCGSSSVKFAIINATNGDSIVAGLVEDIGGANSRLRINIDGEKTQVALPAQCDHKQALAEINTRLSNLEGVSDKIVAVGHRVVHGGEALTRSVRITDDVKHAISACAHMAPLHNPANLIGIESAEEAFAELPHVAVFDTAFFQAMPERAYLYAVPYSLYESHGIRRYGFHGTSHYFVSRQAAKQLGKQASEGNYITAHLGNGCSITAIKDGQAIDTSLGFTPLEGLVMGTRSGDIDPGIISHLQQQVGMSAEEVNQLLNRESGLLGLSGISNDCRTLEEEALKGNPRAILALEVFCYRLAKYIGAYYAITGPLDALVFTGGIGENSSYIRETTLAHLSHMGFGVDDARNEKARFGAEGAINPAGGITTLVIPTNEEWVIAEQTLECSADDQAGAAQ